VPAQHLVLRPVQRPGRLDLDDLQSEGTFRPMRTYGTTKLCNVLFTQELARRLNGSGVTAYALHPGLVASDIWRRVPWPVRPLIKLRMRSPEEGARTPLYCATAPELAGESGQYYEECRRRQPSRVTTPELAAELWERSVEWVGAPAPAR
jgi:NAD(P)-dependent dehydrogenase (short-subunit alcohol dehydrogenase family)